MILCSRTAIWVMALIIIVFSIVSLTLIARSSFNAAILPGLKELYYTSSNGVEKSRFLVEFKKSFTIGKSRNPYSLSDLCPSPSPSLAPTPAPSPATPRTHRRGHPAWHHQHRPLPQAHKAHREQGSGGGVSRELVAGIASAGIACLLICAIGALFGFCKFKKRKRRQRGGVLAGHRGISKCMSSQSSVKKVTSDPGPDLFYLDSLESALESDKCGVKLSFNGENAHPNHQSIPSCPLDESQVSNKRVITTTIVSEICEHEFEGSNSSYGERIIPVEVHTFEDKAVAEENHYSSDDDDDNESFHSVYGSQSSQLRLSNASSSCSVGENLEIMSNGDVKEPHCSVTVIPPPPPCPVVIRVPVAPPPPESSPMKMKSNALSSSQSSVTLSLSTSIPPKGPAGVPPPPRPPPLFQSHSNAALKGPPPPPSQLTQKIPLGKDGSPLPKLKPLHWDKVRAVPNRTTVWDKLRSSSFEFDEEMIESLFGYNLQHPTKNDEAKSKTPSPNKHILDPKRLQNFTILSKALNVNEDQVCGALVHGEGLLLQDLEALSKMVPTKEEEAKLVSYKGDVFELSSAEKLVRAMLKITFAFPRIEAMLYRETFEDEVLHLRKSFSMLEEACKELRSSRLFLKLLEAVLKTGNRMNIGTIRGGAKAFKLDALLKLADVKGTDGRTNLLHFVVLEITRSEGLRVSESIMGKIHQRTIQDKEESYRAMGLELVSGLSNELCNVKKTATIDLDVLASSVANLSDGKNKLQHLIEKDMIAEEKKGGFISSMRSFLKYAEVKLKELQEDENRVLLQVREITEYFHGNVSKDESNPLRIFVIVRDFLSMLDHVCKELRTSKAPRGSNPLAPFR